MQFTGTDHDSDQGRLPAKSAARDARACPASPIPACSNPTNAPQLSFKADRARIAHMGLTEKDVTNALATALAGTGQTAPNFWLNPKNNVSYSIVAQTPEYKLDSLASLLNLPVTGQAPAPAGAGRAGPVHPHPLRRGGHAI